MKLERRIEELETRYAFQEQTLRELDEVLQEFGHAIEQLRRDNSELRAQLASAGGGGKNKMEDEVPPHY